jgi:hypothetical protein
VTNGVFRVGASTMLVAENLYFLEKRYQEKQLKSLLIELSVFIEFEK